MRSIPSNPTRATQFGESRTVRKLNALALLNIAKTISFETILNNFDLFLEHIVPEVECYQLSLLRDLNQNNNKSSLFNFHRI